VFRTERRPNQPLTGRIFCAELIRENLDIGRPDRVQLVFDQRLTRRTPGRFRAWVLTEGDVPSLHLEYKNSHIKQNNKEGRASRTETAIRNTRDFHIGQATEEASSFTEDRLCSQPTPARRPKGLPGMLDWRRRVRPSGPPVQVDGQRPRRCGSAIRVRSLCSLCWAYSLFSCGVSPNQEIRALLAPLLAFDPAHCQ
jgi:hypothetical protein